MIVIADGHIEKEFTRKEFISLTNEECHKMGLRSLTVPAHIGHTSADSTGTLEIKYLTVKNKKHIIFEDLNFSVSEGKILGVLGENGAGKTPLMRCLSGLIKEHSGEVCYEGKPMKLKSRNKLCYMIMQDVNHQLFGESVWNAGRRNRSAESGRSDGVGGPNPNFWIWRKIPTLKKSKLSRRYADKYGIERKKSLDFFFCFSIFSVRRNLSAYRFCSSIS